MLRHRFPGTAWVFLALSIVIAIAGQVLAKAGAELLSHGQPFFNPLVLGGYLCLVLRGFLWILALKKIELSVAYPLTSLTFVGVLVASALGFGEDLNWKNVLGTGFILTGVVFLGRRT